MTLYLQRLSTAPNYVRVATSVLTLACKHQAYVSDVLLCFGTQSQYV